MEQVKAHPRVKTSTRSIVVACIVALLVLAAIGVAGYAHIHDLTEVIATNTSAVHDSGAQRARLLETALLARQMAAERDPERRERLRARLAEGVDAFERAHRRLRGEAPAAPEPLSPALRALYAEAPWSVDDRMRSYVETVRGLREVPLGALHEHHPDVLTLLAQAAADAPHALPNGLAKVAAGFEAENRGQLDTLIRTENVALGVSFAILALTGLFVFAPMVRRVRQQVRSLEELNATLEARVAERTLRFRTSAARLQAILNSVVEAIVTIDERGKIEALNPAAERIFGYEAEEMLGENVRMLMPEPHRSEHDGYIRRYLETGEARIIGQPRTLDGRRKDGSRFPLELAVSETLAGERRLFTGIMRDVTERMAAEAAMRMAKEAAETANRTKSEFLANMSHEIRTPMNGIIGMTELALDTELTSEQHDYLSAVRQSAHALLKIINDILDFSKIEAGKLELEEVPFGLRDAIGNTLKTLATRAHQKGLELAWDVEPDVPDHLLGDPLRLRQVLVNLVGNAIKFTEQGEVVVHVALDAATEDEVRLLCAVKDTGIGIPPGLQAVIFDAFAQADASTTRRYGGTGLGLAISSQLVTMMGGSIELESEADRGSTFRFDVHFRRREATAEEAETLSPEALRDLPVLVVDDNATNRRIFGTMLANWGMSPTVVDGGDAALEALRGAHEARRTFSLVVLDYHMPGMDGLMLAERIRRDPVLASTRMILLTSGMSPENRTRAGQLGITIRLIKPVTQSELLDAVLDTVPRPAPRPEADRGDAAVPEEDPLGGRRLRVLLAEDNVVNQKLAVRLLEKRGHEVVVVETGRDALDRVKRNVFDVVLMDVQMPVMDGYEATRAIRAHEAEVGGHVPVVAMTAHAMTGDRERCLEAGMDEYVSKPIDPQRLFLAIAASLSVSPVAPPPVPAVTESDAPVFDRKAVLARLGGDEELLAEAAALFLENREPMMDAVREAASRRDPGALQRAAHTIRGAISNFLAEQAMGAARRLEHMGRAGVLTDLEPTLTALEGEVERFARALRAQVLREAD